MTAAGSFREDLYYRLAEIVVKIPSLAERPGDAVLLARHFVNRFAREINPKVKSLSPEALAAIDAYAWPGNVRELENRIKRAVIMADGKKVSADDLDLPGVRADEAGRPAINLRAAREIADRRAIRQAHEPHREQYFERRQVARDQPADALRPDQAISSAGVALASTNEFSFAAAAAAIVLHDPDEGRTIMDRREFLSTSERRRTQLAPAFGISQRTLPPPPSRLSQPRLPAMPS